MPVSPKVATQLATAALTYIVAFVVARFGLDDTGVAAQLITTVIALAGGAIGGWIVKESTAHPELTAAVERLTVPVPPSAPPPPVA